MPQELNLDVAFIALAQYFSDAILFFHLAGNFASILAMIRSPIANGRPRDKA
jgi:hypothetical protein